MVKIGERAVGKGSSVYIIAEMSANHNQDYSSAEEIVRAAAKAGANAVKLQTYTPDTMTINCDNEYFRLGEGTLWAGKTLYDLYGEAYTPWEWHPKLKKLANSLGLDLFSAPFDSTAVDFLESIEVPVYKIASFEIVDLALIDKVARTGKPLIISTGMATRNEIADAVNTARNAGNQQIVLLKCTSAYPASPSEMNLLTIPELAREFNVAVGLSDHTLGIAVPAAAVALGACVIEKHFTISRSVPGPDSAFSLEPGEFRAMVESVRTVEAALGGVHYGAEAVEAKHKIFRRSLFVVKDVAKGESFTEANVRAIRPGFGLACKELPKVLGKAAACDIVRGTPLSFELID